jgi:SAM-dependent methyltransferase
MREVHIEVSDPKARGARGKSPGAVRTFGAYFFYWSLAHYYFLPGLYFYRYSSILGLSLAVKRKSRMPGHVLYDLLHGGLEATHCLEFDFFWKRLRGRHNLGDYLDLCSPRVFPLVLLHKRAFKRATLVSPDSKDLSVTAELIKAAGLDQACGTIARGFAQGAFHDQSFDVITSVSTPQLVWRSPETLAAAWRCLRPGGTLLISLPCVTDASEPDHPRSQGRAIALNRRTPPREFYDSRLIDERIFKIVGPPSRVMIYGETVAGSSRERLKRRLTDPSYPLWQEPLILGRGWRCFSSIDELPGEGITTLEFTKPLNGREPKTSARVLTPLSAAI